MYWQGYVGGTLVNVMNCKTCKRLFNQFSNEKICPECQRQLEEKFQEVKEYLKENPLATMEVLSKECDVTIKQIKEWVREERLTFTEGTCEGIECEQCGVLIKTGRYCDKCKMEIQNNLRSAIHVRKEEPKKKERERDRMRFLDL